MAKLIIEFDYGRTWEDIVMFHVDTDGVKWKRIGKCKVCGECCRIVIPGCPDFVEGKCKVHNKKPFACFMYPCFCKPMPKDCGFSWEQIE